MDSTINSPQQLKEYAESILESIKTFSNTVWKCSPEQAISTLAQVSTVHSYSFLTVLATRTRVLPF